MSQEQENARQTDNLPEGGEQALSALREVWSAQNQTSADIDESCGNTKTCKNMETVGFHGLSDDVDEPDKAAKEPVGNNLRAAWKTKLEREGKLSTGSSVRDLVFGSSESDKSNKE
ncbi:MAG: hypothetical protein ACREX8_04060 [Gammaproteobacteria bacterium]